MCWYLSWYVFVLELVCVFVLELVCVCTWSWYVLVLELVCVGT